MTKLLPSLVATTLFLLAGRPAHAALRSSSSGGAGGGGALADGNGSFGGLHAELAARAPDAELLPSLFPLLDGDGDGVVSREDLTAALLLGAAKMRASDDAALRIARTEQLEPLFRRLDKDGNGRLGDPASERDDPTYAEQRAEFGAAKFDRLWRYADADGDGALSLPEFVTQHFPELGPHHTHDAAAALRDVVAGARNGRVDLGKHAAAAAAPAASSAAAAEGANTADRNAHAYSHHRAAEDLHAQDGAQKDVMTEKAWEQHHRNKWAAGHAPAYHLPEDKTGEDPRFLKQILATQAAAFRAADTDGDGVLAPAELAGLHRAARDEDATTAAAALWRAADGDGDGRLTPAEARAAGAKVPSFASVYLHAINHGEL